jgi:hypothetical protein
MSALFKNSSKLLGKATLATAALGGLLLFAGAPSPKANYGSDGDRRIDRAEWKLHEAIEHHGYYAARPIIGATNYANGGNATITTGVATIAIDP